MELKKTKKANLENKRNLFFQLGIVISLGIVFMAFKGNSTVKSADIFETRVSEIDDDFVIPPTFPNEPPKPLPPPPKIIEIINLIGDNTEPDENFEFESSEIDKNTLIYALPELNTEKASEKTIDSIFVVVEEMPRFPGDEPALLHWIATNINYPTRAIEIGLQGKVFVSFVVDKDGRVINAKIARGVDPILNEEALRVVNGLPKWKPGMQRGKPVKVAFSVPINFQIQ